MYLVKEEHWTGFNLLFDNKRKSYEPKHFRRGHVLEHILYKGQQSSQLTTTTIITMVDKYIYAYTPLL